MYISGFKNALNAIDACKNVNQLFNPNNSRVSEFLFLKCFFVKNQVCWETFERASNDTLNRTSINYHIMFNNKESVRHSSLLRNVTVDVEVLETSIRIMKSVIRRIHVEFVSIHNVESTDWEGLGVHINFLECLVFFPVVGATGKVVQLEGKQPEIHQQVKSIYKLSLSVPSWRGKLRLKSQSNFWYSVMQVDMYFPLLDFSGFIRIQLNQIMKFMIIQVPIKYVQR